MSARAGLERVLEAAAVSDVGRKRARNEDAVGADPVHGLFLVADGMGGHQGGDVASAMAAHVIGEQVAAALAELPAGGRDEVSGRSLESIELEEAIRAANRAIHQAAAAQPGYADMGTTVVAILFHDDRAVIAHVGDSRLYRLRDGQLERLTVDHSVVQEMIDRGVRADELEGARFTNVVTRALGPEEEVEVDLEEREVHPGDLFLLCSDGLTDMLSEEEIRLTLITFNANLKLAAEHLVGLANEHGGRDNVSVVLARPTREFPANRPWVKRVIDWFL
ncbi:Stp1/IreP family PP2C-type Ser/Thr phosphatase [Endothiovibrio diazotrophicus]